MPHILVSFLLAAYLTALFAEVAAMPGSVSAWDDNVKEVLVRSSCDFRR